MKLTRREAMAACAAGAVAGLVSRWGLPGCWGQTLPSTAPSYDIAPGPFQPTWQSLEANYRLPDWYRDAKFGIWAHWGPQCQPGDGDWYAKYLYIQGKPQYDFHLKKYGHPSKFGFKDVINQWKAEKWDPAALVQRFKSAGARFLVSMANHHDNFDNFNSKYQPWNSVNVGPKKDIVGTWAKVAREAGLNFGVSVHAARAWTWYEDAQGSDKTGPLAGVPYDGKLTKADGKGLWWEGLDPQDLYAQNHAVGAPPDAAYLRRFFNRIKDLLDQHHPDLVFFDDAKLPLGDVGLNLAAHLFNSSPGWNDGKLQALIVANGLAPIEQRAIVNNLERNMTLDLLKTPWNKGNCLGPWHYSLADYAKGYHTNASMIHLLVDVVSKNGTFLLAIPQPGSGEIDDKASAFLDDMGKWMAINSECIYGTHPWTIYGEGPSVKNDATARDAAINPPRGLGPPLNASDIRFTTKGDTLYAIVMGKPADGKVIIKSLAAKSGYYPREIASIQLAGSSNNLSFSRDDSGVTITMPESGYSAYAIGLKIIPRT